MSKCHHPSLSFQKSSPQGYHWTIVWNSSPPMPMPLHTDRESRIIKNEHVSSMPRSLPGPNMKCYLQDPLNTPPHNTLSHHPKATTTPRKRPSSAPQVTVNMGQPVEAKRVREEGEPMETIECKGKLTVLPKSRSTGDRTYICNGHPIHRVTFWRHRKHGCPHENEGLPTAVPKEVPRKKTRREKTCPGFATAFDKEGKGNSIMSRNVHESLCEETGELSLPFKTVPYSVSEMMEGMPSFGVPFGYMNHVPNNNSDYIHSIPMDPSSFHHMEDQSLLHDDHHRNEMMPPFSVVPDSHNLYFAPFRPSTTEQDDVYKRSASPSARSDGSDFLDGDMVFNSYLRSHHHEEI